MHTKPLIMKRILVLLLLLSSLQLWGWERQSLWPKCKMPDAQPQQIAAMTDESGAEGFNPDKHRMPYLEWFEAPENPIGVCMILISGGGYNNTCDVKHIDRWHKTFTALGIQCVSLVYRTPRPEGIPIYQTAWEDGQRAVRLVRSQAAKRGYDPEKIGAKIRKAQMEKSLDALVGFDAISKERREELAARVRFTTSMQEAVTGAQFIQESGPERIEIKRSILAQVEEFAAPDAIYASSTSGLLITDIAAEAKHPERCVGAHPYNPPHLIPLVEITRGERTAEDVLNLAYAFYQSIGKEPVVLKKE